MTANLLNELKDPQIEAAVKLLGSRGLGVTVVHGHDMANDVMCALPEGVVQLEDDLQVRFVPESDPDLIGSVPVTVAQINGVTRVIGRCRQGHGGTPSSAAAAS